TSLHRDSVISGKRRNAQTRTHSEIDSLRKWHRLHRRQDNVFRRRAESPAPRGIPHPHVLADARPSNIIADLIDHARTIAMRHDPRKRQGLVAKAGARFYVGGIDAGGG